MNRRTSFITAAAVTGVILAGTTAVAANIGILAAADGDNVGNLSASASVTTLAEAPPAAVDPQVIDVYIEDPAPATSSTAPLTPVTIANDPSQVFSVDIAGTVDVHATQTGVLLDDVSPSPGWEWSSVQNSPGALEVTFTSSTSSDSTYVFYAELALDGTITARVDQPIVKVVQAPAAASGSPAQSSTPVVTAAPNTAATTSHDDDRYEVHDSDDHGSDDHGSDDHEGGEDDD